MKLKPVGGWSNFRFVCKHCNRVFISGLGGSEREAYADLDGKAFEDYYCKVCAESLQEGVTISEK